MVIGFEMAIRTNAIRATGMFTQKIARHVHSVRNPPRTGPIAVRPPAIPKNNAKALPRSLNSKVCTTIARAAGNMMAPPTPCIALKVTIQASAKLPLGVSPQRVDAPANTITPTTTILRCPNVSASRPPKAKKAASDNM